MKQYNIKSIIEKCLFAVFFISIIAACDAEVDYWDPSSDQKVITDIVADSSKYSEFFQMMENTSLDAFLSIRGPYTLFLPDNEAMFEYYALKGVNSLSDFSNEEQRKLIHNHTILAEIYANDIGLGAIREPNALQDKLATEFDGSEIIINKSSRITKRDIKAANGLIHEIDKVIDPLSKSLFEIIESNPDFSLFTEGLEITGIKDTLNLIEFPWGNKTARTKFTILAVPDTVFHRYGISTIDQMIDYFTDEKDKITDIDNGFYQYIEYHCLNGEYYLSDFETQLYPILSFNNNIRLTVDDPDIIDYLINFSSTDSTYTGFYIEYSNVPARNGAFHVINDLLPVEDPEPTVIIFDTCEQFELMQGDFYMKHYKKFYDGQNDFKNIKFEGDYLQYYYKDHNAPVQVNFDGLQMIGFWWIEVTTPKVMKGKYELTGYVWGGRVCDIYIDDVRVGHIGRDDEDRLPWGVYEWTETTEHKIRMVAKAYSTIFWDTIELTPVEE
jgi:uncharacterized surface protein with fasciclin (FAS1) repeats